MSVSSGQVTANIFDYHFIINENNLSVFLCLLV